MDQAVYETLLNVGNPDGTIRSAAEQRLKEFASSSPGKFTLTVDYYSIFTSTFAEFPVSLARLTVSQDISIPQRQISFLLFITMCDCVVFIELLVNLNPLLLGSCYSENICYYSLVESKRRNIPRPRTTTRSKLINRLYMNIIH